MRQKCRSPSTGAGRGKVKVWVMKFPTVLQAQDELAGLYEAPTGIYEMIGISERGKVRTWSRLHCKEALSGKISDITWLYLAESDAIVPVKP